ncbi:MAG: ABC transporter ATP-binding protein/permease, partial [Oscillospiraceae bacterium]|nr:ABC transporter ATP-binding protein/permease [Oscillospiraceae bacterium]
EYCRELWSKIFSYGREMGGTLTDVLTGVRVVKVFSKEKEEVSRFDQKSGKVRDITKLSASVENSFFPAVWFILSISGYLAWLFGGYFVVKGQGAFTYGMLMSFMIYINYLLDPLGFFVRFFQRGVHTINAFQRLFEIMDAVPDVIESENPVKIPEIKGGVEFKAIEFSYEKNRKIIDGISFAIEPGKALGIVGHTGAGKSTLANLLARLYDVGKGEIAIDGVNIKNLSFDDLHSMISMVSQETYLFMGSVADNIKYAKQDATPEEIITAAKIASAHDFIMELPDGYQTRIGYGQKEFSGGEKQRISIARAVLKNPKILIMDEATAAMDTETERQIQRSLSYLTKNRTTIIIAHRLSTLRDVDKLIVIENGKMTESGTHSELISKKGAYFNLYKMQAQALKSIGIEE